MSLPVNGQLNWGTPLNSEITADETNIAANTAAISAHVNNSPADPHGDRAYALGLFTEITTGTNQANGYVVANAEGKIPLSLVPTGAGLTNFVDAIPDLSLTTNGSDISTNLNAGIASLSASGGGIMWVGSGEFGLAYPILMYPNVWLWCSPGAVFNRLQYTTVPPWLITNFSASVTPSGGNIWVSGGTWNVANISSTGSAFCFAGASFLNFRDMQVTAYNDGKSPAGRFYGCTNVNVDNVSITASAPANSGRNNQTAPLFEIEECNATNIPGIPSAFYAAQECVNVKLRGVNLSAGTLSDSSGPYCAWSSFVGTTGIITGTGTHTDISIGNGCMSPGLATAAIQAFNWVNMICVGNFFSYPAAPYTASWQGISAATSTFVFNDNSPSSYNPSIVGTCTNTTAETVIAQFAIPANDWLSGTTCYNHHVSGTLSIPGATTLTLKEYLGTSSTFGSDTLIHTQAVSLTSSASSYPFAINHRGFDIDTSGNWTPCGWEFTCSVGSASLNNGSVRVAPVAGGTVYITITATWTTAASTYSIACLSGCTQRPCQ